MKKFELLFCAVVLFTFGQFVGCGEPKTKSSISKKKREKIEINDDTVQTGTAEIQDLENVDP